MDIKEAFKTRAQAQLAFIRYWDGFAAACADYDLPEPGIVDVIWSWQHMRQYQMEETGTNESPGRSE